MLNEKYKVIYQTAEEGGAIFKFPGYELDEVNFSKEEHKILEDRLRAYDETFFAARAHFMRKNLQYGNAIGETGVLGAVVEFVGITSRLKNLVLRSSDHGRSQKEKLQEILKDLVNYSLFSVMFLAEENWEGK